MTAEPYHAAVMGEGERMRALDFLGGTPVGEGAWRFEIGRALHGAFGGANGGVLAATCIASARGAAPGRIPAGLDARFLRGLPAGAAEVQATLLHAGRTLSCVSVDIRDARGRLCTRGTVTLLAPEALAEYDDEGQAGRPQGWQPYERGTPWPKPKPPVEAPLIDTFGPRVVGQDAHGVATEIRVLWDEPGTCAEAACIAADISVGPPVGLALRGRQIPIPNPDLSLRFCAEPALPSTIIGAARLERIARGIASTRIEVWAAGELVAVGVSTTTLLAGAWPDASRPKSGADVAGGG